MNCGFLSDLDNVFSDYQFDVTLSAVNSVSAPTNDKKLPTKGVQGCHQNQKTRLKTCFTCDFSTIFTYFCQ